MITQAGEYSITSVSAPVCEELRGETVAFWRCNGAIADPAEAQRRADELVCVARNANQEIVGVNTAYVSKLPGERECYWFYRMFIRPPDRHVHLTRAMMGAAVNALRARPRSEPAIRGVLLITENRKIMRTGGRRFLAGLGWHRSGSSQHGLDIWRVPFE